MMESDSGSEDKEMVSSLIPDGAHEDSTEADVAPHRMLKTICLFLLWICYGLLMSISMTSLVDFTEILQETYSNLGMALSVRFVTIFCGLYLGGYLQDGLEVRHELLLAIFAIVTSVVNLILPYSVHVIMFAALVGAEGLVQGIAGPVANNLLMSLWREKSPTPVNLFHFSWGLGSLLGPLLSTPFLSERCLSPSGNITGHLDAKCGRNPGDSETKYIKTSRIGIPFTIGSVPMLIMSGIFLFLYFRERRRIVNRAIENDDTDKYLCTITEKPKLWRGIIIGLLACFYCSLELGGVGGYLFTVAFESDLRLSKDEASKLSAAFNACYTAGRFLSSVFLQSISIKIIFIFYVIGTLASMIALAIFGLGSSASLWLLSCLYGIYSGPLWPCAISWTNHYMHLYTINIATAISGAQVGAIFLFWLGGHLIDTGQISTIFFMTASGTALTCLVVGMLYTIGCHIGERKFKNRSVEIELDSFK